jgi:transposase
MPLSTQATLSKHVSPSGKKPDSLYFPPPYSPELNLIENLWRFIKYRRLPFNAYHSYPQLKGALENILANFGKNTTYLRLDT